MNSKTYAIIKLGDISLIDFSQVAQSSESTVRKSLDNTQFVIKWQDGYEPTFISDGKVKPLQVLSHSECLEIMATPDWSEEIEEKVEAKK
jgi:hypothetical protein